MGIDPVGVDENNVHSHNRYAYANNNPYKFVDPDGNEAIENLLPEGAPVVAIGKAFAGLAAYSEGVLTGNEGLKNVAMEGMSENRQSNIEAIVLIGSMGRGGGSKYVSGGKFSKSTKATAAERADKKCEYCGIETVPAKKSERGVTPPKNEGQTDHIEPRSSGGTNSPENAAHSCRECNRGLSNSKKPSPRSD